jgi:hypothetical protein
VGGAWAAGNLVEREGQAPLRSPTEPGSTIGPESTPTTPAGTNVSPSPGRAGQEPKGRGPGKGKGEGADKGRRVGPPDERPGLGHGRDRKPRITEPGHQGLGSDRRDDRADPGGPKGTGGGRRSDSPR